MIWLVKSRYQDDTTTHVGYYDGVVDAWRAAQSQRRLGWTAKIRLARRG